MNTAAAKIAKMRIAKEEVLTFPEPFFWTSAGIEQLRKGDVRYRSRLVARALDALNAPAGKVRLVADGDSWFDHPCLRDTMDWVRDAGFAVFTGDAPGRRLATMLEEKVYLRYLDDPRIRFMLLSGGGNDLIDWKRPSKKKPSPIFKPGNGSNSAEDYINQSEVEAALTMMSKLLDELARDVWSKRPKLPILTHFYDYFVPQTSGPFGAWIGPQMTMVGVPTTGDLRQRISKLLVNRANDSYKATCAANGIIYVDLRNTVKGRWYDEIHPNDEGFSDIAKKILAAIP